MNISFAYLLGLIIGNGTIQRGNIDTTIIIEIPHKNFKVDNRDVHLYVSASLNDIRNYLEPTLSSIIRTSQVDTVSRMSFTKANQDYLITEINRFLNNSTNHEDMRIHPLIFNESKDVRLAIMQGISDSTAYVRRSNYFFKPFQHRVYIEIPKNWELVIDVANLLKSLDIPVQNIDWAHPNMRDGKLIKYNQGNSDFWKKEHQIKVWAIEYLPIGFKVRHKQEALEEFVHEHRLYLPDDEIEAKNKTHKYYWNSKEKNNSRLPHPRVDDEFIPKQIRGRQMNSWRTIANELGYNEES